MHIIGFNATKALGNVQTDRTFKLRLLGPTTSISLRLNAFFSKNDVKGAKTHYFALKTRFTNIVDFNSMKALVNVQRH